MGHIHSVFDTDAHFKINPITRKLSAEGNSKVSLVQFDHNSERFTFEIPKLIEGHDMSSCNKVEVHFTNIDKSKKNQSAGVYIVNDMQVSEDNGDVVIFSWLISRAATLYEGSLNFIVKMICQTKDVIDYQWNTEIYSGISVSAGINNSDVILEDYIDVLEEWKETISEIPPDKIKAAVDQYLQKHPVTVEEQDPTVPEWAKAESKPKYTASEVGALPSNTKIPTKLSELTNDSEYAKKSEVTQDINSHNTDQASHNDLRVLIKNLTDRLNTLANSDDATLDQMSEVVAYIKNNKSLIDGITTSKVNVSDIINNLTTNLSNKPLSAAMGVELKKLIDKIKVPVNLSELAGDTTHRTVTDAEKTAWDNKSTFSGRYNDLSEKPTLLTEARVNELISAKLPKSAEEVLY